VIIVDAHEDIAYNAVCLGRDYRDHTLVKRRVLAGSERLAQEGIPTTGLPDALIGRVAIVFATIFVEPPVSFLGVKPSEACPPYETPQQAYKFALKQLDYYTRLADNHSRVRLIQRHSDLEAVLATWADDQPFEKHVQGMVILMENGDPILEPRQFYEWYERGVRIVGPAWSGTRYCGGTGAPGGLTTLGRELLEIMASLNAVLDLSHMAEEAFLQAVDSYQGASIIASHSNPRKFRNSDRHLSDDMIRRLAERDGVIGIVPYNRFLSEEWRPGDPKSDVPAWRVIDAIDHVCQLTGSAAHVGIGTDFDGGFGSGSIPDGLDSISDLISLADLLAARGYSPPDINAIMGGNMLRKLRAALPL